MDCPSCAKKIENAVTALPGVDSARVLFATEKLVVDAQSDISLRIQDAVARRLYPARHSDRQSRRAENLTLRRIRTAAAVSHPDGRQLGAGSG